MPEINDKMNLESVAHEVSLKNESTEISMQVNIPKMEGIREAAEIFGVSQNYVRQLALSGTIKAVRVGKGKILVNVQSLSDYFNNSYITTFEPAQIGDIQPIPANLRR